MTKRSEIDELIADLKGKEVELKTKSSEVSRRAKKYDYIVQVWSCGKWFNIYSDSNYEKAKAVMIKSEYKYTRIQQLY